jgi:ESCRT-II complex subunit
VPPAYLSFLISCMVAENLASYEPSKQTRSVLLYWRLPEEWAEVLYEWVCISFFSLSLARSLLFIFMHLLMVCLYIGDFDWPTKYNPNVLRDN